MYLQWHNGSWEFKMQLPNLKEVEYRLNKRLIESIQVVKSRIEHQSSRKDFFGLYENFDKIGKHDAS